MKQESDATRANSVEEVIKKDSKTNQSESVFLEARINMFDQKGSSHEQSKNDQSLFGQIPPLKTNLVTDRAENSEDLSEAQAKNLQRISELEQELSDMSREFEALKSQNQS